MPLVPRRKEPFLCTRCGGKIPRGEHIAVSRSLLPPRWDRFHETCAAEAGVIDSEEFGWPLRGPVTRDDPYEAVTDRALVALDDRPLFGVGDDVPFQLRVAQTVAWCTPRVDLADPAGSLRSEDLRPRLLENDRVATVQAVWLHRCWLDNAVRTAEAARSPEDLGGGKLLIYFPDSNLSDGAAEAETGGFFDSDNVPPWDTWVGLFRDESADISDVDHLVTWVPGEFIDSVERGINVNPEACILWLADSRVPLAAELHSRGLLA